MISLKQRRLLYLSLIIIFLLITPIFILYTLGYRYNFDQNKLQKTGALFLRSKPSGAAIYLNNQRLGIVTPNKISGLLPKEYQIKIEKEGYEPWQKNLSIVSTQTTFAEDIYLIKNNLELQLIEPGEIINFAVSPDNSKIFYNNFLNNLYYHQLFYLTSLKSEIILKNNEPLTFISWSNNSEKILLKNKKDQFLIIDLANQNKIINLWQLLTFPLKDIYWDDQNSNLLWIITEQQFFKLDLLTNQKELIVSPKIISLLPTNLVHYFIYLKINSNNYHLALAKYKKFEQILEIAELPPASDYLIKETNNWLFIYSLEKKLLYFLKFAEEKPIIYNVLKSVNGFELKNNNLLYWNDFEYWIYDLTSHKNQLIERIASPVINVFWHPQANYLFMETTNILKFIEINERDIKNNYLILTLQLPINKKITFNNNARTIIFATTLNNQSGLYYLLLQ